MASQPQAVPQATSVPHVGALQPRPTSVLDRLASTALSQLPTGAQPGMPPVVKLAPSDVGVSASWSAGPGVRIAPQSTPQVPQVRSVDPNTMRADPPRASADPAVLTLMGIGTHGGHESQREAVGNDNWIGNEAEDDDDCEDSRRRASSLVAGETSREVLLGLFHLTLTEAASHLGVGRTYFKKICRMRGIREWPNHQKLRRETAAPNSMDIHSLLENQSANMAGLRPIQDIRDNWLAPGPALLEKPMGIGGGGGAPPLAQDPSLSTLIRNASTNPSTNRMDTDYQMQDARLGSHFLSAFHPSSMDNDAFAGGLADHQAAARIITHCPAPPVAENEAERLAALHDLRVLDTPPEPHIDELTKAAQLLFGTPIALVSLVDGNRQWFKSKLGLAVSQTERCHAFCAYTIMPECPGVFCVENALEDERFRNNPLVVGPPYIRFYAGAPLVCPRTRNKLGSLCVIDTQPRKFQLNEFRRQCDTLAQLSTIVIDKIVAKRLAATIGAQRQLGGLSIGGPSVPQVGHGEDAAAARDFSRSESPRDSRNGEMPSDGLQPNKRLRRSRTASVQHKLDMYAELYNRIMATPNFEAVGKDLSDKELRVLMRENKIMINNLNPVTGKYVEKTKAEKLRALLPLLGQLVPPDALRLKARAANAFALEQLQRQRMAANSGHAWGLSSDDMSSSGHADVQTYMHSKAAGNSLDSNASGDGS